MCDQHFHHCLGLNVNRDGVLLRRDFLKGISAAALAGGMLSWTDLVTAQAAQMRRRGMACILLWMNGGPSQFETFSPKPGHANGGETKAIATAVPGIQISENYPELARYANDVAFIRSVTSREGAHPRAAQLMHTGYLPMAAVKYPTLGSIVVHEIAEPTSDLPSFVRIGGGIRNDGSRGGFLGVEYDPLEINNAGLPPTNARPATDVARFKRRLNLLDQLQTAAAGSETSSEIADHRKLYERASRMMLSPDMGAFDLAKESDSMRDAYGRHTFGAGCLLARRLVESGVTFVEVVSGGWDTHDDNFNRSKKLSAEVDQPFAMLIKDLKQRDMLDNTLIIWMGEFGRSPRINARGGRDHYPRAFNVALAGGGIRGGQVVGKTDDGGTEVTERPVTVPDLFQTFCKSLKIDASKENMSPIGRPIPIVDGGSPVNELFS